MTLFFKKENAVEETVGDSAATENDVGEPGDIDSQPFGYRELEKLIFRRADALSIVFAVVAVMFGVLM